MPPVGGNLLARLSKVLFSVGRFDNIVKSVPSMKTRVYCHVFSFHAWTRTSSLVPSSPCHTHFAAQSGNQSERSKATKTRHKLAKSSLPPRSWAVSPPASAVQTSPKRPKALRTVRQRLADEGTGAKPSHSLPGGAGQGGHPLHGRGG